MCTVSFCPTANGYQVAVNRDELRTREHALPPEIFSRDGLKAIYPYEPAGGTWVGINEFGITFALVNWHAQPSRSGPTNSRGTVVPALLAAENIEDAFCRLSHLGLEAMQPFRLMAFSWCERIVREWRSAGVSIEEIAWPWEVRHWFSSGFDEAEASRVRAIICRDYASAPDAGSLPWLRRLHRSHLPRKGPFSICMHRPAAATVSYTEICVTGHDACLRYHAGAPCSDAPQFMKSFQLPRLPAAAGIACPCASGGSAPAALVRNGSRQRSHCLRD